MESPMRKYYKALVNLAIAVVLFLLLVLLLPKVLVFFLPFVIGWIIAWIASPLVRFLEEKLKLKRKASSAFVIIVVIALVVLCIYLIGAKVVEEAVGFVNDLPVLWEGLEKDFADIWERLDVIYARFPQNLQDSLAAIGNEASTLIGDMLGRISSPTIEAVGNFAKRLPSWLINVIMCLLSSYFFVAERNYVTEWCHKHAPRSLIENWSLIRRSLTKSVGGYFKAQLKIEIWMYILLVIGLSILKVDYVLLIALAIALLDFFPFFGTGTIMVPWAVMKLLSSDYQMSIGLLIIWGVGQLARQIIQPKIVGDSIGVPPIPTLLLLFFGYKIGGVLGMIMAVPLGLLLYTLYEEGAFETTQKSVLILIAGINRFRKLKPHDMDEEEDRLENKRKTK